MNVTGIVAEYNPFHNGHEYHLSEARKLTEADCIVVFMSGDFVQRGEPAIFSKYVRAHAALLSGADLVIEIPTVYATASAEGYAAAPITMMNAMGGFTSLSFGMEGNDLSGIKKLAEFLAEETEEFKECYTAELRSGKSSPLARSIAIGKILGEEYTERISTPNNILAVEYCKALVRSASSIQPFGIPRLFADYHDSDAHENYAGAEFLRKQFSKNGSLEGWKPYMKETSFRLFEQSKEGPVLTDDLSDSLNSILFREKAYDRYADLDAEFSNRIRNDLSEHPVSMITERAERLRARNLTYTHSMRALAHILLGIRKEDLSASVQYLRVLGMNGCGQKFLHQIKKTSGLPILTAMSDAETLLSDSGKTQLSLDVRAANIYNSVIYRKYGYLPKDEYRRQLLYLP